MCIPLLPPSLLPYSPCFCKFVGFSFDYLDVHMCMNNCFLALDHSLHICFEKLASLTHMCTAGQDWFDNNISQVTTNLCVCNCRAFHTLQPGIHNCSNEQSTPLCTNSRLEKIPDILQHPQILITGFFSICVGDIWCSRSGF